MAVNLWAENIRRRPAALPFSARTIQAQLRRVLEDPVFARADRSSTFLNFLVARALQGQNDQVSEYAIATEVFGRRTAFDPSIDAIVRVEAGRLRQRLSKYYQNEGQNDPVLIELPPRTYVPVFRRQTSHVGQAEAEPVPVPAPTRFPRSLGAVLVVVSLLVIGMSWKVATSSARAGSLDAPGSGRPAARVASPSIAVLPLLDLSPGGDQEYFCDGLTEEITETLTKLEGLRVVARTSAFRFKGKTDDVRRIGAELDVATLLEGSVRKDGNHVRVDVHLVHTTNGYQIWSQSFDRKLKDVFAIQREVAQGIVAALRGQLTRENWLRPLREHTPVAEAYNLFLHGRRFQEEGSIDSLGKAAANYEQAVRVDPAYAAAYAQLARCYADLGLHSAPAAGMMAKAKAAAERSLKLDDAQGHAHAALGLAKAFGAWDWRGAGLEFQRARELDPSEQDVLSAYVVGFLIPMGRLDEALAEIRNARAFDPISPRPHAMTAYVNYFRRDFDQAIAEARDSMARDPDFRSAYLALGLAYERKSMFAEAVAAFQTGTEAWPYGRASALLGYTYARMGDKAHSIACLNEFVQPSGGGHAQSLDAALVHIGLDDRERAFEWLEKAYAEHAPMLAYLRVDPRYDGLRSDPRFLGLMQRVGLGNTAPVSAPGGTRTAR